MPENRERGPLKFAYDRDDLGQRLTESGSVDINGVRVPWARAAGYVDKQFRPRIYNTLNVPLIQLVFTNFYLGIAEGALTTAAAYTRDRTRPRPYALDVKDSAVEEFPVLETYGDLQAKQRAIDTGLEIGTRIFEVTGARATANSVGLDVFWRNIRTHSLHDPVAHKRAEVGRYALLGEIPQPTWYT